MKTVEELEYRIKFLEDKCLKYDKIIRAKKVTLTVREYIELYFAGRQVDFAVYMCVKPQQVSEWIRLGYIIVDGLMYSYRRDVE